MSPLNYRLKYLLALAALLFVTGCSSTTTKGIAENNATGEPSAETVAQADDDPLVCEMIIPSGTRIGQKVCMRKSQKDRIREHSQTATIENQRRAVLLDNPVGN